MRRTGAPALLLAGAAFAAGEALADEGMWPLQLLPTIAVRQQYGVDLTPEWLNRVREASVRNCLAEHSARRQNLLTEGFLAASRDREPQCSSQVADVLLDTEDVTAT